MADLEFTRDETKARSNAKKHGVSFDKAQSAFSDARARIIDDPDHSDDEDRFILLGMRAKPRILIVVYAYRDREAQIRGRDELRPYLEEFARAFPDARYKFSWGVESGSRVALEGVYSATHTGTLRMPDGSELAAIGRHVSVPFVALFDVQGDKIASHRAYWDVATVMAQLGLAPAAE